MAVRTLETMGLMADIEAVNPAVVERVRIVGPFGGEIDLAFKDCMPDVDHHALVLPRKVFDDILRHHAIRAGSAFLGKTSVETIERAGDRIIHVTANTPKGKLVIEPRHVVIAMGANIGLLRRCGFLKYNPRIIRASRGYFSGVETPINRYDFFFDQELLPGYGWIFPTGNGQANIGAGVMPAFWATNKTSGKLLDGFIERRSHEKVMRTAKPNGPIKGYPLRIDFPFERIAGENWIIVGESTGLVNPVTGEGIDLAIESGLLGAEILHDDIQFNRRNHITYQRELTHRFGPMFAGLNALRDILITPLFVDYVLWEVNQYGFLAKSVMQITQGFQSPQSIFHPLFILQFFMPVSPRLIAQQIRNIHTFVQKRLTSA
jgi:flavin-dependent dehydrogenase